jgi:hypothetical protein
MEKNGNVIYHHNIDKNSSKLNLTGQLAAQPGFSDLHYCDSKFVSAFVPGFDVASESVRPLSQPFIARLENARVEFPGFGVFLGRNLLMEESYHGRNDTEMAGNWFGAHNNRHRATFQVGLNANGVVIPVNLDVKYYLNRGSDQRIETPALMLSGASAYNYCHWMNEMVPRLWCWSVVPELRELPVIVRAPLLPFQQETLAALGIGPERIVPFTGIMLEAETLYFPSYLVPSVLHKRWSGCAQSAARLRNPPPAAAAPGLRPRAARLKQPPCAQRGCDRHATGARGFEIVHLEGMTVKQQLELFSSAAVVVMPEAAGNQHGVRIPGATLIELHPPATSTPCTLCIAPDRLRIWMLYSRRQRFAGHPGHDRRCGSAGRSDRRASERKSLPQQLRCKRKFRRSGPAQTHTVTGGAGAGAGLFRLSQMKSGRPCLMECSKRRAARAVLNLILSFCRVLLSISSRTATSCSLLK